MTVTEEPATAAWWEGRGTDWTRGDPGRVADVLAAAYPEASTIRRLTGAAGIAWTAPTGPARDAWVRALVRAAGDGLVLDLMAQVLLDDASEAFQPLLSGLLGDRLGMVNARIALRHGLPPPPPDGPDAVVRSLEDAPVAPGDEPTSGLEAITAVTAGLEDPRAQVQALLDAMRRTARIEIGGLARGTGFLVGPDLLLTAAHVIDPRRWPPDPRPDVVARFDFGLQPGRSLAETGVVVPVVDFVTASLPTAGEADGSAGEADAPADRLDFALVRLGFPVPDPAATGVEAPRRGCYPVDPTEYDFARSPLLFIVQHPLGQTQRVTWIRSAPAPNPARTRIRYGANTLAGSSGSPVVDIQGRLVALHHYSERGRNQGVPLSAIARALRDTGHGALFRPTGNGHRPPAAPDPVDVDPFLVTTVQGRPFVNRANLRSRIRDMACGGNAGRLLTVRGDSGSGVSYSYVLLSHVAHRSKLSASLRAAAPDGLAAVRLDLRDYVGFDIDERRERIVRDVLVGLDLPHTDQSLAQTARSIATFRIALAAGLRDSPRQWWIFVDGLDHLVAIRQGDLDELIHALVQVADDPQVPLRLVLAGREAEEFAAERSLWVEQDTAIGLARGEVEAWFRERAREERRVLDEPALAAAMGALFPDGQPLPEPRRLAAHLPKRLLDLLEASGGP